MNAKSIFVQIHAVAGTIGFLAATLVDVLLVNYLFNNRISDRQFKFLKWLADAVVGSLGLIITSAFGFLVVTQSAVTESKNPILWGKVGLVFLITLNGIILHQFALPYLARRKGQVLFETPQDLRYRPLFFTCSGLSFMAWTVILLLSIWKQSSFVLLASSILLSYFGIGALAVVSGPVIYQWAFKRMAKTGDQFPEADPYAFSYTGSKKSITTHELLRKEIYRAQRYGEWISLLSFEVKRKTQKQDHDFDSVVQNLDPSIHNIINTQLRMCDHLCVLGQGTYLVILPHTGFDSSEIVKDRLWHELKRLEFLATDDKSKQLASELQFVVRSTALDPTLEHSPESAVVQLRRDKPASEATLQLVS